MLSFGYFGLDAIVAPHGRWRAGDGTKLGIDRLEVYERVREGE
jgi:diaminohydroxyphosphoribosylaminopyrimidine deaminase/5-amino-6-(5-phosphoribosylamino)uracil reductase